MFCWKLFKTSVTSFLPSACLLWSFHSPPRHVCKCTSLILWDMSGEKTGINYFWFNSLHSALQQLVPTNLKGGVSGCTGCLLRIDNIHSFLTMQKAALIKAEDERKDLKERPQWHRCKDAQLLWITQNHCTINSSSPLIIFSFPPTI